MEGSDLESTSAYKLDSVRVVSELLRLRRRTAAVETQLAEIQRATLASAAATHSSEQSLAVAVNSLGERIVSVEKALRRSLTDEEKQALASSVTKQALPMISSASSDECNALRQSLQECATELEKKMVDLSKHTVEKFVEEQKSSIDKKKVECEAALEESEKQTMSHLSDFTSETKQGIDLFIDETKDSLGKRVTPAAVDTIAARVLESIADSGAMSDLVAESMGPVLVEVEHRIAKSVLSELRGDQDKKYGYGDDGSYVSSVGGQDVTTTAQGTVEIKKKTHTQPVTSATVLSKLDVLTQRMEQSITKVNKALLSIDRRVTYLETRMCKNGH
ncbi:hypothetical protein ADUPG1_013492 [Aduncisulcus paluster]|uniref:Uncharacterized protein n=1 Tax=Aduncisulcus paluster TaxID=2918883 RepID=A0ABQ5K335_9EUKA|nr:hypothetical protein ADUPG1_013492 [Aduncisulcus paluster]